MPQHASRLLNFPVTVSEDLALKARALLCEGCRSDLHTIRFEALPDDHAARLWVTVAANGYGAALHALICGLPAAEFGAVTPLCDAVLPTEIQWAA